MARRFEALRGGGAGWSRGLGHGGPRAGRPAGGGQGRPEPPLDLVPPSLHTRSAGTCLSPGLTAGGRWGRPPALPLSRGPSTTYSHATPLHGSVQKRQRTGHGPDVGPVRRGVPGAGIRAGFGGRRGDPERQVPGSTAGGWGPSSSEQWCPLRTRQPGLQGPECGGWDTSPFSVLG